MRTPNGRWMDAQISIRSFVMELDSASALRKGGPAPLARTLERYRHHAPGGHSCAQRPPPPRGERVERTAGASKAAGDVRHGVGGPRGAACRPHRPGGCSVRASGAAGGGFRGPTRRSCRVEIRVGGQIGGKIQSKLFLDQFFTAVPMVQSARFYSTY